MITKILLQGLGQRLHDDLLTRFVNQLFIDSIVSEEIAVIVRKATILFIVIPLFESGVAHSVIEGNSDKNFGRAFGPRSKHVEGEVIVLRKYEAGVEHGDTIAFETDRLAVVEIFSVVWKGERDRFLADSE